MKKIAIAGFGFMGRMHYGCWGRMRGAKVAAICDSNLAQLKKSSGGNIAGADFSTDFGDARIFDSFDGMLAAGGFDIVDITLPTPLHPAMAEKALAAGYHVLCEKPMALDAKSCDRMLAAASKAKGRFMVAQCLRFWPCYVCLKDLVGKGTYGKVVAADFSRLANAPGWNDGGKSWFLDESKSGGVQLDLHIHDADMINWLFGLPDAVTTLAHRHATGGWTDHAHTLYEYSDKVVTSTVSWAPVGEFGFESGFRVMFERATAVGSTRPSETFTIYPSKGKPFSPRLGKGTGYENEIRWFLSYVNGTAKDGPLTPLDARNSVALVDAERKSARSGRRIHVKGTMPEK